MKVAELQHKLDVAKSHTVACDYEWTDMNGVLTHRALMIGRIVMYVHSSLKLFKSYYISYYQANLI